MRTTFSPLAVLWKKELTMLGLSPALPAAAVFFLLGTGIPFFFPPADRGAYFTFRQYVVGVPLLSAIVLPALTMGIWSLERKQGTERLLLALPVSETVLVLGKFFALLAAYAAMLVLTLPVLFFCADPHFGSVFSAYLLLFFYGGASLAAGQLMSILFAGPAVSWLATAALLLALNTVQILPQAILLPPWLASVCLRLSFAWHLEAASRGILDSRDLLYYLVPTAAALLASAMLVRNRRIRP